MSSHKPGLCAEKESSIMKRLRNLLASLQRDERGLTTVEYAIVLCVIVAVAVGTWDAFGDAVNKQLTEDTGKITDALKPNG